MKMRKKGSGVFFELREKEKRNQARETRPGAI